MKQILSAVIIFSLIISCEKNSEKTMLVKGNIEGLKKGTLYLQKHVDSLIVSVDSIQLNGISSFELSDNIESPEIYYISLSEIPDETIPFFGEKGIITVTSKLPKFEISAKVKGSKNQDLLYEYMDMVTKFNDKNLDYIKEKFEARKENDSEKIIEIENAENNLLKRKYLYTTNFALSHANSEVAPYLALTELFYANVKLLDTINNSLSKNVKASKYGIQLNEFIENIKKTE